MSEERAEYRTANSVEIRQASRVPFADPNYATPAPEEIRTAISSLAMTGSEVGRLLGVTGRTIRKWTGGEREIPYAAWRLLLIEAELAEAGMAENLVAECS